MNRRMFVKQLSAGMGAALTPGVIGAILSGRQANAQSRDFLTGRELELIASLADAIIPRTDTPGARDAGVPRYIEMLLAEFTPADRVTTLRWQLEWVSTWLADRGADSLESIGADERNSLLTRLDEQAFGTTTPSDVPVGDPALFAVIKPLTVAGYYTSEIGAQHELHQPPFGPYEGDVPFDDIGKSWS